MSAQVVYPIHQTVQSSPTPTVLNTDKLKQIRVFVPNTYIGAVIGFKGSYIKTLQTSTTTMICVESDVYQLPTQKTACIAVKLPSLEKETDADVKSVEEYGSEVADSAVKEGINAACTKESNINGEIDKKLRRFANMSLNDDVNRLVQITGTTENILKAMFWVFQRVAEVCEASLASIQLHVEFSVPERVVGIIIGKNGVNITQLKRISKGCDIHVDTNDDSDANICMFGAFGPCLSVVCRINHMRRVTNDNENNNNYTSSINGSNPRRQASNQVATPSQPIPNQLIREDPEPKISEQNGEAKDNKTSGKNTQE